VEERLVRFRPRAVLLVLGIILAAVLMIEILQVARGVLIWIFIAVFLALALNPAVEWLLEHGIARRGVAVAIAYVGALLSIIALGASFVPILIDQVNNFVNEVPSYVEDLTRGEGRLGFLERDYQITDRVREAIGEGGASGVLGLSDTALAVTKGVLTAVVATVTIAFLTLFMLLEGPAWVDRFFTLLPEESQ
jgi:predicted PurR-regulated permease PerM